MEYKIGFIPKNFGKGDEGHKFIIVKEGNYYVYYAEIRGDLDKLDYSNLAAKFKFEDIVCSGLIDHSGMGRKYLGIWSGPLENKTNLNVSPHIIKATPKNFMKCFERLILESYKNLFPYIEKLENNCNANISLS